MQNRQCELSKPGALTMRIPHETSGSQPSSGYQTLLSMPTLMLVSHVDDRPDVRFIAILGYN